MKIACLVLGYAAGNVLARSAVTLAAAGFDIYLHIDRKLDRRKYIESLGAASNLCKIIEEPVEIFWGGFSMIRAELLLISEAKRGGDYDDSST